MVVADNQAAAVVIGRNEGDLLKLCLESVRAARLQAVYVDSGSTDDSVNIARKLGVEAVELTPERPFSAARGRNEGLDRALVLWPRTEYVLFLDGDCALDPAFPAAAFKTFESEPECAVVTGHLYERHPRASVYNRLCAIEWRSPAGRIENMNGLGGIMMVRVSAFRAVKGFNEQAIAGEEPDFGVRLALAGFQIVKIDHSLATHDARMVSFAQWWRRAVRGGHAVAHRYARHGRTRLRDGERELASDLFWGFAVPVTVLALLWPSRGLSLLLLGGYALLFWRVRRHYKLSGLSEPDAWLIARFTIYTKFAHILGIVRYLMNRMRGRYQIIEWR